MTVLKSLTLFKSSLPSEKHFNKRRNKDKVSFSVKPATGLFSKRVIFFTLLTRIRCIFQGRKYGHRNNLIFLSFSFDRFCNKKRS